MGYLLKEGLKTLCGVNQWSYAVFWKIGCQNPKLLIWEECYYEPASCSGHSDGFNASWMPAEASNPQAGDKVHLLVNKMMMDSHVNIVGEGLVGRVAFTGNHQWILSQTYCGNSHPPEVVKEVCQQFSAGMQTVAVVPVLPHGVVQFGSCMTVMENLGFINDVTSLILQLGYVSGALLSPNHAPTTLVPTGASPFQSNTPGSLDAYSYAQQIQYELQLNGAASNSNSDGMMHQESRIAMPVINGVAKAEVITSNAELWKNQNSSMNMPRLNSSTVRGTGQKILPANVMHGLVANPGSSYCAHDGSVPQPSVEICDGGMSMSYVSDSKWPAGGNTDSSHPTSSEPKNEMFCNSISADCFASNPLLAYTSDTKLHDMDRKFGEIELQDCKKEMRGHDIPPPQFSEHLNMVELFPGFVQDDVFVQPELGDDLFDILGSDFKNRLLTGCWNSSLSNESASSMQSWDSRNSQPPKRSNLLASSELYSAGQANSESGIFSSASADHLLEAVVSKIQPCSKQIMDDNVSCRTTLTNTRSSSVPNTSLSYGRLGVSDHMEGELYGVPKYLAKAGAMSSSSSLLKKRSSKEESTSYSQGSSMYGSQISSWMEKDQKAKPCNSVSISKPEETGKANRKRLKPGENPRPRPKDRQMFQDRVKELREIVPNGAKCSLDALLENTIKHMLFLQSVTKHADKLKQTGESKIISKDGGLLLKDNFEGGATWAYEVGSQSMVCPIIVEDLNQPRQMLVQMLCEERGLFLEIADIIRGLGLTILKGVMETRNDKIWARFAVEANRDVTRMEIFISLVRLLEQSSNENAMTARPVACSEDYILSGCVKSE